ncbi:MAG: winged helix-turn-helix domain-containing protein [Gemmatimonadota bacterium]|jgi:DNA-binding IclR family transcriptional regulator
MVADNAPPAEASWTFLTNHSHVLLCLYRDSQVRLRDVAELVGITERSVQRIVHELEEAGVIARERDGRRNSYRINPQINLRHPLESHTTVGELLRVVEETRNGAA